MLLSTLVVTQIIQLLTNIDRNCFVFLWNAVCGNANTPTSMIPEQNPEDVSEPPPWHLIPGNQMQYYCQ